MIPLVEIFCFIDDFCKAFEAEIKKHLLPNSNRKRYKPSRMSLSEIMTVTVLFHLSHYKTFKDFYLHCICQHYRKEFPNLLSYNRFVELMPHTFMPLVIFLTRIKGVETGKYYIDSTKLPVSHNLRISRHKVFKDSAQRGKTSTGWFFGFKLHLIINDQGEIVRFTLTPGNVHDSKVVEKLSQCLKGWLFGDRGYVSEKLHESLLEKGLELITTLKKNMKKRVLEPIKKQYLKKRVIVETMIDQLKNKLTIDHSRHRSPMNFQVNILAGLVAYAFLPHKVSATLKKLNFLNPLISN